MAKEFQTIGYLRVSTSDQDLEKDKAGVLLLANAKGFGQVEFMEEKVSGYKTKWRDRKIKEVIDRLGKSDKLIIPELSRLGRSLLEIMEILAIAKEKEIDIFDVKNGWELNGGIQSSILAMAFAIAAEIERDLISKRTKAALAARKAAGVKLGRPPGPGRSKLDPFREEIIALLRNGSTKVFVSRKYGVQPPTLYNWLTKNQVRV